MGGDEGVPVGGVRERFLADRFHRLGGELAAEAAPGEPLAAAAEDRHRAADRGGDRRHDLLQAALFEDQSLEPALHGDAPLQHLVLLVDEAGEGLLGDRDERGRVGHLEEREVPFLRLLDQRFRQLVVVEAGAEAEAGEVVVGEQADEGALFGRGAERDPGGQHQLATGEPRGRVLQLGDVDPAHRRLAGLGAGSELEVELVEQALDGEHPRAYLSDPLPGLAEHAVQDVVDFFELLACRRSAAAPAGPPGRRGRRRDRSGRACRARRRGSRAAGPRPPRRRSSPWSRGP